jgi:hypothetical protein
MLPCLLNLFEHAPKIYNINEPAATHLPHAGTGNCRRWRSSHCQRHSNCTRRQQQSDEPQQKTRSALAAMF